MPQHRPPTAQADGYATRRQTQPDLTQKMIFDWMPVIFAIMLASFPAGDLLGREQHAVGRAAGVYHAPARGEDRAVGRMKALVPGKKSKQPGE